MAAGLQDNNIHRNNNVITAIIVLQQLLYHSRSQEEKSVVPEGPASQWSALVSRSSSGCCRDLILGVRALIYKGYFFFTHLDPACYMCKKLSSVIFELAVEDLGCWGGFSSRKQAASLAEERLIIQVFLGRNGSF